MAEGVGDVLVGLLAYQMENTTHHIAYGKLGGARVLHHVANDLDVGEHLLGGFKFGAGDDGPYDLGGALGGGQGAVELSARSEWVRGRVDGARVGRVHL